MRRLFTLLCVLSACAGQSTRSGEDACSSNEDCRAGEECRMEPSGTRPASLPVTCPYARCTSSVDCIEGAVCQPWTGTIDAYEAPCDKNVCTLPCSETGCAEGFSCASHGACTPVRCDEPNSLACPEHFRCDPVAAPEEPALALGSTVVDAPRPLQLAARGCVRKRCNETGGFVCHELWECSPATATDGSGCVPIPCTETGHCSNDTFLICDPGSSSVIAPPDVYGCVYRTCTQGYDCSVMNAHCEPGSPDADGYGCVLYQCDERPELCGTAICDLESPERDAFGCRGLHCDEGLDCSPGLVCDPRSPGADGLGCRFSDGSGGSGTAGSGAGGASPSGGTSSSDVPGRCVPR